MIPIQLRVGFVKHLTCKLKATKKVLNMWSSRVAAHGDEMDCLLVGQEIFYIISCALRSARTSFGRARIRASQQNNPPVDAAKKKMNENRSDPLDRAKLDFPNSTTSLDALKKWRTSGPD